MTKYLISRVDCDNEYAEMPDVYVLPLSYEHVSQFSRYASYVKGMHSRRPNLKCFEFEFTQGYWLNTGNPEWVNQTLGENNAAVIEADVMAIVGEDVIVERVVVEPGGEISFRCLDDNAAVHLYARPIHIGELEKAYGVEAM